MHKQWLERWENNQIGFHEAGGNAYLQKFWGWDDRNVLVPLCGKAVDMAWLAARGNRVTGVELSDIAAQAFFDEQNIDYDVDTRGVTEYRARDRDLRIVVDDFLAFRETGFDAVFDRAALVALPADVRPTYTRHLRSLLAPDAVWLLVTLEYPQEMAKGPPYSVPSEEVARLLPDLVQVEGRDALDTAPPKFVAAGVPYFREKAWIAGR